jgi:hypothetical protein
MNVTENNRRGFTAMEFTKSGRNKIKARIFEAIAECQLKIIFLTLFHRSPTIHQWCEVKANNCDSLQNTLVLVKRLK